MMNRLKISSTKLPGVDRPASTDLPVLHPRTKTLHYNAMLEKREGTYRLNLQPHHLYWVTIMFVLVCGAAYAQTPKALASPIEVLIKWIPFIMKGFGLNLIISFLSMAIGTVLGAVLGLMQISLILPVRWGSWAVTQFFRNSPWLVLLFCFMLLLPFEIVIGNIVITVPGWFKATIALSLPIMANISEIVRGAVRSLPSGQWESAESLAFTRLQTLWMIILPQCIKRMIPPWMNWYAILTMATPLCSILGVEEAVKHAQEAMAAEDSRPELLAPFYSFLLVIFFLYCYPIARWTIALEKRYAVKF